MPKTTEIGKLLYGLKLSALEISNYRRIAAYLVFGRVETALLFFFFAIAIDTIVDVPQSVITNSGGSKSYVWQTSRK